jgi:hypothetical protein
MHVALKGMGSTMIVGYSTCVTEVVRPGKTTLFVTCVCRVVWQTNGTTPLYVASQKGFLKCVRALLDGGAAINQAAVGYCSSMARHCGVCVRKTTLFVTCVCRVVWQTNGVSSLCAASCNGHVECVQALLDGGAAIDQAMVSYSRSMAWHCGGSLHGQPVGCAGMPCGWGLGR